MREPFLYLLADRVPGQVIAFRPLMVDGFEVESGKKKKRRRRGEEEREERSSGNIPAVMFARTDRLFQHLCLRIDGCPPGIKKNVRTKVEKFEPPPRNLSLYLLSNDDGLTTILGRRGGNSSRHFARALHF